MRFSPRFLTVAARAQRLEWARPEFGHVAAMRHNVIDRRGRDAVAPALTFNAPRMRSEICRAKPAPAGCVIQTIPLAVILWSRCKVRNAITRMH